MGSGSGARLVLLVRRSTVKPGDSKSPQVALGSGLDRGVRQGPPFGPGAVIDTDFRVPEYVLEDKPDLACPISNGAVRDHATLRHDLLVLVESAELVRALEGAILSA